MEMDIKYIVNINDKICVNYMGLHYNYFTFSELENCRLYNKMRPRWED